MKHLIVILIIIASACGNPENEKYPNSAAESSISDSLVQTTNSIDADTLPQGDLIRITDEGKVVKVLWRDKNQHMRINQSYCKTLSDPERAAIGYIATPIGNDCEWDGECNSDRSNLKCVLLWAIDLGYQCSERHLGFLRKWFRNEPKALKELSSCSTTPFTSTFQDTFEEIVLTIKENDIKVFFKASGIHMREELVWDWSENYHFRVANDQLKIISMEKSEVVSSHYSFD
jgi:hypothetical protein